MPKFSAYMRGEGTKGDTGEPAGFGNVTASVTTSLPYGSTPQVSVEKSGEDTALNLDFQFGLVEGEAAGFSTNQKSNIEFISVTSNPSVSITTDNTSPNNSKVFNFDFKIPEPLGISEITAVTTTTSEGINEITIWYNNGTTTSFNISNGAQGETGFIEGEVATTTELPTQGNHIGRGFLVGQEGAKHLFVYLNNEWTDQGLILGAGFGEPTSSAESIPTTSLSTASGSLVHITDAAAMPVESLKVKVEPVQDLHGQSAPYPAGSGKNKLGVTLAQIKSYNKAGIWSNNVYTMNSVSFTVTTDDNDYITKVVVNGTATGGTSTLLFIGNGTHNDLIGMVVNGCPSGGATNKYSITGWNKTDNQSIGVYDIGSGMTLPTTLEDKSYRIYIAISDGFNVSNANFFPMIRSSSVTDATYAPYSNECPISIPSTATIPRTGENLINIPQSPVTTNGITFTPHEDGSITVNGTATDIADFTIVDYNAPINFGNTTATFTIEVFGYNINTTTLNFQNDFYDGSTYLGTVQAGNNAKTKTFSGINLYLKSSRIRIKSGQTFSNLVIKPMMVIGSTVPTEFVPYQGQTVTINLGDERYGGTVDALTGIMTVDRKMVTIDGVEHQLTSGPSTSGGYTYYACNIVSNFDVTSYNTNSTNISKFISNRFQTSTSGSVIPKWYVASTGTSIYVYLADQTIQTRADANSWFASNNTDFVVPLAEPFTIQLTPAQLSLLQGENNIWSNTGDIEVTYAKMNEPSVEVTIDPESPESAKIFDFNFKIPQGEKGDKGDTPIIELSTSVTSLPQNTDPTLSLTTLGENNFRFDFGLPKGFVQEMTATATANDLEPGSDASATVTVDQNNLNFTFGIPQGIIGKNGIGVSTVEFEGQSLTTGGNIYTMNFAEPDSDTMAFSTIFEAPQGPEGIGFYQKLEFTSTSTNIWIDGENGTSTLIIDRTAKEIIPINIYNSTSNNIAATFTLADPTAQYPHGSIQYNTNEKFDGTLYYIGESPTPQVEIGSVTTVAGTTASVIASKNGHNTVLDFVFPTKGDKGDTGTSIASVTYDHEADNKTYYKMLFTDSTSTLFAVDKGDKGDTGEQGVKGDTGEAAGFGTPTISVNSLAEGQTPTAQITATGDNTSKIFSFTFGIPKGDKGDQGIQGVKGDQGDGITNISAPVVDGLTKTYTITYGNNDNTTSFSVEDGLAATINFSTGIIIDNTIQQPTTIIEGTSTNPLVTFKFPDSYGSDLKYTAGTTDFPENGSLTTGYFYFQYEEE